MDTKKCNEWEKEKHSPTPRNPFTSRKIKVNGPKYRELNKLCDEEKIVEMSNVCLKWLKENHNNLYLQLIGSSQAKQNNKSLNGKNYYTLTDRQINGENIKTYFKTVVLEEGKACLSDTKTLLKYVHEPKLLGYGSFGNVYSVKIPGSKVAIKEGRLSQNEFRKAMDKSYPMEYLFNKLINDLLEYQICPNFSYTFAIFFCDRCNLKDFNGEIIKKQCSETVTELFDYTLHKLEDYRDEVILSILFQILFGVTAFHIKYGIYHRDIKRENILVKQIQPGGYWIYEINGKKYKVPNYGYIPIINDFGVSSSYKPGFSLTKSYGIRQIEVLSNDYFIPISDREKIDYDDVVKFPPYHFHCDIIDSLSMFAGGKRCGQTGYHSAMSISNKLKRKLKEFKFLQLHDDWPRDKVELFLAFVTIEKIFDPLYLNNVPNGPLIEEYKLEF
jgi:serine/threonine protein kinase